ncbi:Uncharacterised protein [Klebsiella oxytoca]|nr:Uncharacterised protein [Klebsiella oxytoca]SAP61829.1 Uncharacterised protein [Klebsiella oxytoca]
MKVAPNVPIWCLLIVCIPVILQVACALASSLAPVTYLSKLLGTPCVAAFLQLELFRVY